MLVPWTRRIGAILGFLISAGVVALLAQLASTAGDPGRRIVHGADGRSAPTTPTDGGQLFYLTLGLAGGLAGAWSSSIRARHRARRKGTRPRVITADNAQDICDPCSQVDDLLTAIAHATGLRSQAGVRHVGTPPIGRAAPAPPAATSFEGGVGWLRAPFAAPPADGRGRAAVPRAATMQDRAIAGDLLLEILIESDVASRELCARRLQEMSQAPKRLLRFLALDAPHVAQIILSDNKAFDDADLCLHRRPGRHAAPRRRRPSPRHRPGRRLRHRRIGRHRSR